MSNERGLESNEKSFQVPVNFPFPEPLPAWAGELDGYFLPPSFAYSAVEGDESQEPVQDFRATRYELAVLARHYQDELMSLRLDNALWHLAGEIEWRFVALAGGRLALIETLLGTAEYKAIVAEIEGKWTQEFVELEEAEKCCKNSHASTTSRPHVLCVEEMREKISPLAAEFPGLTEEQARCIFDHKPFIGMTLKQADAAFGCQVITSGGRRLESGFHEEWQVSKSPWGTEERWILSFHDGKLVKIEDAPENAVVQGKPIQTPAHEA